MKRTFPVIFRHRIQQDAPRPGHAASQNEDLRINNGGDIGQGPSEHLSQLSHQTEGRAVALPGTVKDGLCRQLLLIPEGGRLVRRSQILFRHADDSRGGGILLQTALLTAAAAFFLILPHLQMADFSGRAESARDNFPVQNDAAAYAGAERHHNQIPVTPAAALPHLSQSSHVRVISRLNRNPSHQPAEHFADRHGSPAQIHTAVHDPSGQNRAGYADPGALQPLSVQSLFLQILCRRRGNIRKDMRAGILPARPDFPLVQQAVLL